MKMPTENEVYEALASAIVFTDTAWGGDGKNPSGLYRVVLDSNFTGKKLPKIYENGLAEEIRGLARKGKGHPDLSRKWLDGKYAGTLDALAEMAERMENPHRKRYLQSEENALRMLAEVKRAELKTGEMPEYRDIVRACTGCEAELIDIKPLQEQLRGLLKIKGYGQENLHEAADAWSKDLRILTGVEIKDHIEKSLKTIEKDVRKHVMPLMPKELRYTALDKVEVIPVPKAFFSASNNYLGNFGCSYEYNLGITKSVPELDDMTMHEFGPGHYFEAVLNEALLKTGMTGIEAGLTLMGTPKAALAEGIAVAAPYIMLKCGKKYDNADHFIARVRDQLDATGRLNGSFLRFENGWKDEEVKAYVREECCFNKEWSERFVKCWLGNTFFGKIYAPAYGLGNKTVKEALNSLSAKEVIPILYGARGAMDLTTFQEAVKGASAARPAATDQLAKQARRK